MLSFALDGVHKTNSSQWQCLSFSFRLYLEVFGSAQK